ncbi:DUF6365 family protein [Saccharothrix australiensis]|uniref:Glycosyl transferase family 1 n=1 Tax=Saccharothrix australiensis TaxID=2072 RepID=A0A495W2K2_9PSEU|nr:DUF6365 family protein [Saccharothrix australiensis]RKT55614.1 hypothetical protein C8E97_4295 [Saccharothrix australiensis]
MKLLFFSLSAAASGETFIGLSLAEQLRRAGVESHFVHPPVTSGAVEHFGFDHTVVDYADCPKGPSARAFVDELVASVAPDAIVLCDYNVFIRNVRFHFQLDPVFIDDYGLPVLPVDLMEWEDTDFEIDLCGAPPLPVDRGILAYPAHLRPVPPLHLDRGGSTRALPYRVVAPESVDPATSARIRADLGLGGRDRLVMLPVSAWQRPPGGRGLWSDMMTTLTDHVPDLVVRYLGRLPEHVHFLVIGQAPPAFDRLPAGRLHVRPPCAIDRYTEYLGASDAVVLLSPPSVTGARAVLMDKPVLIMQNRFPVRDGAELAAVAAEVDLTPFVRDWLAATGPIDRFRMWPKGSFRALDAVFTANDYTNALITTELLDETGTVRALHDLVAGPDDPSGAAERLAKSRARYLEAVAALPDAVEVIREAVGRGPARR